MQWGDFIGKRGYFDIINILLEYNYFVLPEKIKIIKVGRVPTQDFEWDSQGFTNRTNLKETWEKNADFLFPEDFLSIVSLCLFIDRYCAGDKREDFQAHQWC